MAAPKRKPADATFGDRTPWTGGAATAFVLITFTVALLAAGMAQPLHARLGEWLGGPRTRPGVDSGLIVNTLLTMLVLQCVIIAMVWWGAARFGGERRRLLSLGQAPGLGTFLRGLLGMAALLAPWNLAVWLLWPEQFGGDLRPFWDIARSPALWLAALVLAVLAPLSEELLFRGFLLPALSREGPGFFVSLAWLLLLGQILLPVVLYLLPGGRFALTSGAALVLTLLMLAAAAIGLRYPGLLGEQRAAGFVLASLFTTAGWTALHAYSLFGMIEVFLIGLYFCWLIWRHGSLWLPIGLHAIYNGGQLAALALWP